MAPRIWRWWIYLRGWQTRLTRKPLVCLARLLHEMNGTEMSGEWSELEWAAKCSAAEWSANGMERMRCERKWREWRLQWALESWNKVSALSGYVCRISAVILWLVFNWFAQENPPAKKLTFARKGTIPYNLFNLTLRLHAKINGNVANKVTPKTDSGSKRSPGINKNKMNVQIKKQIIIQPNKS